MAEEKHEQAVVVGASGAFGERIIARLTAAGLGVVAVARTGAALQSLAARHAGVVPCEADITDDAAIERIRAAVTAPVRIVVNAAGVPVAGGVLDAPTSAMLDAVNIKVNGLLRLVRAVDARLVAGSRIVGIGGLYGLEPTAYSATGGISNAALMNLVRQLSLVYGPRGITAHVLSPGPADTERMQRIAERRSRDEGREVADIMRQFAADSPIKRLTTPDQIAWAVSLLLAPEADALAGSTLMLDSGRRKGIP